MIPFAVLLVPPPFDYGLQISKLFAPNPTQPNPAPSKDRKKATIRTSLPLQLYLKVVTNLFRSVQIMAVVCLKSVVTNCLTAQSIAHLTIVCVVDTANPAVVDIVERGWRGGGVILRNQTRGVELKVQNISPFIGRRMALIPCTVESDQNGRTLLAGLLDGPLSLVGRIPRRTRGVSPDWTQFKLVRLHRVRQGKKKMSQYVETQGGRGGNREK